ncbi:LLM class flavin-dependent oxidoreductase [Nocardioides sp. PD653]|uniref:LLM class flavin-dependent oxidoreductase n=1 Tax=Nocardioides sp. PD653 TaxID=393303 RepID=UPI0013FD6FF0|nr:LLM class flavin-dependent oxidoreductase [Nocardioides sp. PD653]
MIKWGVGLGKVLSASAVPIMAARAEQLGYDEAWVSNERFHRDMFVSLGAAAVATHTIRLGTFVADPFMIRPPVTAAAVASVDELSGGRAMFGIGAGGSGFAQVAMHPVKPVRAMETALTAFRALLAGERVTCEDANFELREAVLEMAPRPDIPLTLASQSPKMLELGGRIADSVMISTFADRSLFELAVSWAAKGAEQADRQLEIGTDVVARIDVAIDEDLDRARDALRPLVGQLLVLLYPNWFFLEHLGVTVADEVREFAQRRDYAGMRDNLALVPDRLVDGFGWVGPPERVADRVQELTDLGVRRIVILPHSLTGDPEPTIAAFKQVVAPRVERAT